MAEAGLGWSMGTPVGGSQQAGLNEPQTMKDRNDQMVALHRQGYTPDQIYQMLGVEVSPPVEEGADDSMGLGGLLAYGAQAGTSGLIEGAAGFVEDRFGWDDTADFMFDAADAIGPTDEQEERRQRRRDERNAVGDVADDIAVEAPSLAATVGASMGAGAAAGSVIPLAGTAVGTAVGALTGLGIGFFRIRGENRDRAKRGKLIEERAKAKFGDNPTPEQYRSVEGEISDDDVRAVELTEADVNKVDITSAIASAPEAITPLKILGRVTGGKVGREAIGSAIKKAIKEGSKDAATEGLTEVFQEGLGMAVFNPDIRAQLSQNEVKELLPYVQEQYGKDLAHAFFVGAGLGGTAGGGSAAYAQSVNNAGMKRDLTTISGIAEKTGVSQDKLESLARTPEGAKQIGEASRELGIAQNKVMQAESKLQEAEAAGEDPELISFLSDRHKEAVTERDAAVDKHMPAMGGMTAADVRKMDAQKDTELRTQAITDLTAGGAKIKVRSGTDTAVLAEAANRLNTARTEREAAEEKDRRAVGAKQKKNAREGLRSAIEKEADARAEIAGTVEGKDPVAVREAFMEAERGRQASEAKSEQTEASVTKELRAYENLTPDKAIARAENKLQKHYDRRGKRAEALKKKREQLEDKLDTLDAGPEFDKVRDEINALDNQGDGETPVVIAARRFLQGQGRDFEPAVEEQALPADGEGAPARTEQAATQEAAAKPEASGEAAVPAPKVSDVRQELWGDLRDARKEANPDLERSTAERILNDAGIPVTDATVQALTADGNASNGQRLRRASKAAPEPIAAEGMSAKQEQDLLKSANTYLKDQTSTTSRNKLLIAAKAEGRTDVKFDDADSIAAYAEEVAGRKAPERDRVAMDEGFNAKDRNGNTIGVWSSLVNKIGEDADLASAEETMRAATAESKNEISASFDVNGNLLGAGTNDHENAVSIPANRWDEDGVTMTHTHPLETPPSGADMVLLSEMGNDATIRAVTPTQTIEVRKMPGMTRADTISAVKHVTNTVKDMLEGGEVRYATTTIEFNRIVQEATLRYMEDAGVIDVSQPMKGFNKDESAEIENIFDRAKATDVGGGSSADVGAGTPQAATGRSTGAVGVGAQAGQAQGSVQDVIDQTAVMQADMTAYMQANNLTAGQALMDPQFLDRWRGLGEMMLNVEGTNERAGYGTPADFASRQYDFGGETVTGRDNAVVRLIDEAIDLAAKETGMPKQNPTLNREAIVIMGPPAAGKSSIAGKIAYDNGAAIIDSDEAKKILPEYADGAGAAVVHEESSDLGKDVLENMANTGVNMVIPKVGDTLKSMQKTAATLEGKGYTVRFVLQDVTPDSARERMASRFVATGRLIPSFVSENVGFKPQETFRQLVDQNIGAGHTALDGEAAYGEPLPVKQTSGSAPVTGTTFDPRDVSVRHSGGGNNAGALPAQPAPQGVGRQDTEQTAEPTAAQGVESSGITNPQAARDFAKDLVEATLARKTKKNAFAKALESGELTEDMIADVVADMASGDGMSLPHTLYKASQAFTNSDDLVRQHMALYVANEMDQLGIGRLERVANKVWDKTAKDYRQTSDLVVPKKLQKHFGAEVPKSVRLRPPMADPNDTSQAVKPNNRLLKGPALDRALRTIRSQQANRFLVDHDYVEGLTWEDMVSSKGPPLVEGTGAWKKARFNAQRKLARLKAAAKEVGDGEVGFQYTVDKKGRTYPNGEFHPQAGETIKGMFIAVLPDGSHVALRDMDSVDHTGSGYQIAAFMARDEVAAPLTNIVAGQMNDPNPTKGDLYTNIMSAFEQRLRSDAAAGSEHAQAFIDKALDNPDVEFSRNVFKPPTLAMVYGGGSVNFLRSFNDSYGAAIGKQPKGFWGYVGDTAYSSVEDAVPATKRFKDWALAGLKKALQTMDDPRKLQITVGRDADYNKAVFKETSEEFRGRDQRARIKVKKEGFEKVEGNFKVKTDEINIPKMAKNYFSQIIQGFDAAIMHESGEGYRQRTDGGFVTTNHDSYTVPPENGWQMSEAVREAMFDVMGDVDVPARLRQEILDQTGVDIGEFTGGGSYNPEDVKTSMPIWREGKGDQPDTPILEPTTAEGISGSDFDAQSAFEEFGVDPEMWERSIIQQLYSGSETPDFSGESMRPVAEYLQALTPDGESITNFKKSLTPEQRTKIAKLMAAEAKAALDLKQDDSAADWYTNAVARAMDIASIKYPMMKNDADAKAAGFDSADDARFAFLYAMSVTSQNLDVRANAIAAIKSYDQLLANIAEGNYTFGKDLGTGNKAPSMQANFDKFETMMGLKALQKLTPQARITAIRDLFDRKQPLKVWRAEFKKLGMKYDVGQTAADVEVYGSAILGPKIGNGFYQNLNGNYSPITIDLWARRMWGRMTGKNIGLESAFEAQRDRLKNSAALSFRAAGDKDMLEQLNKALKKAQAVKKQAAATLKKIENGDRKGITGAKKARTEANKAVDEIAAQVADVKNFRIPEPWKKEYATDKEAYLAYAQRLKRVWDRKFKELQAASNTGKVPDHLSPTWALAAKAIVSSQLTPLDQVNTSTQRKDIEATMHEALDLLRNSGVDITPADLQAILWYPEKDLWGSLSNATEFDENGDAILKTSDLNESYDTVIADILDGEGYDVEGQERNTSGRSTTRGTGPQRGDGQRRGDGRSGQNAGPDGGRPTTAEGLDLALGRETYEGGWLHDAGITEFSLEQAQAVAQEASRITGVPVGKTINADGGWADPANPSGVSTEPSSITEVLSDDLNDLKKLAAVMGDMAGQHSVMTVQTEPDAPNAMLIEVKTSEPAGEIFKAVNALDPDKFEGFSATEDGVLLTVFGERDDALIDQVVGALENGGFDAEIQAQISNAAFIGADTDGTREEGQGYAASLRNVGVGETAGAALLRDGRSRAKEIFGIEPDGGPDSPSPSPRRPGGSSASGPTTAAGTDRRPVSRERGQRLNAEIASLITDRGSSPRAITAGLRHSSQYNYGPVERSGEGAPFLTEHLKFTASVVVDMADMSKMFPKMAPLYQSISSVQIADHKAKVQDATSRGLISPGEVGPKGWYQPARTGPTTAEGVTTPTWMDVGAPKGDVERAQDAFKAVVDVAANPSTFANTMLTKLEDKMFNQFAPIRRLEMATRGKLGIGSESAYKAAETAINDSGRNEQIMFQGAAKRGKHGEFTVADGTMGLRSIFDLVANSVPNDQKGQAMSDWMGYMAARRAKELHAKGIKTPIPEADVDTYLAKETPAFKQAAEAWRKHNNANIQFLVDTGRISKPQAKAMMEDAAYVPFYRSDAKYADGSSPELDLEAALGGGKGRGKGGALMKRDPNIKKMIGGDKQALDNMMTNMIRNSQAFVSAGMRNDAANLTFDLMQEAGMAKPVKGKPSKKPDKNAVAVWRNGKKSWVIPTDPDAEPLLVAMAGLSPLQLGRITAMLAGVGAVFRQGITLSPAFMVRNAVRGAVATGLLSGGANLTAANNTLTGFRDAYNNGSATRAFKAQSGMGDYRFGSADVGLGKNDILIEYGLSPKTAGYRIRELINKAEHIGSATELADRVAGYNTLIAKGVRPDEAAYQMRAVMDYARKGSSAELRAWLPMVPFLNARLQGFSRLLEGGLNRQGEGMGTLGRKQALMKLALHGAVLTAITGAIWALNAGDEEKRERYKAEPLHRRLNYHIIYVGDKTLLIPKAFELGHIFSSIPELFADAMFNDMNEIGPGVTKIVKDTVMFNAIPAAALPIIEGTANYSFFRQQAIEGMREQNLKARDRVSGASSISKFIGQNLGISDLTKISPTMIEHYLQGYGGTYFLTASSAMDLVAGDMGYGSAPVGGAFGDVPLASGIAQRAFGSMLKVSDQSSNKYMEEFYRNKDYITQIYRSAKAAAANGDVEYAQQLLAEVGGTAQAYKIVNKAGAELGKINEAIRFIRADTKMSPSQKKAKITPLIRARNDYVRKVSEVIHQIEEAQGTTFKRAS